VRLERRRLDVQRATHTARPSLVERERAEQQQRGQREQRAERGQEREVHQYP
jgi:hypothetical protein